MASTLKQRLRRFNGTDYDTIYLSPNVGDATGTLTVSHGGTGRTTLTSGYFLRGNGTSAITMSTAAASRNAMGLGNSTGALAVANGGTGQTTLSAARNAMGLGNTTGALPVANGGTGLSTLTSGYFLRGNGTSAITMTSIDDVKTALGIGDAVHVVITGMTETRNSSRYTYTASNLGFVVKALYGCYIDTNGSPDIKYEVIYPIFVSYQQTTPVLLYTASDSTGTKYVDISTNTATSFTVVTSNYRLVPCYEGKVAFFG